MKSTTRISISSQAPFDVLNQSRLRLIESLAVAAARLESQGEPPTAGLLEELDNYQSRLTQLHREITGQPPAGRVSWQELQALWSRTQSGAQWETVCSQVLTLRHTEVPQFAPLQAAQSAARSLQVQFQQPVPQLSAASWNAWEQGCHPLQMLLLLVAETESLDDQEWAAANELVAETYGKSLSTAIARGKIRTDVPASAAPSHSAESTARVLPTGKVMPDRLSADPAAVLPYQPDWGPRPATAVVPTAAITLPPVLQSAWEAQQHIATHTSSPVVVPQSDETSIFEGTTPLQQSSSLRGFASSGSGPRTGANAPSLTNLAQQALALPSAERGAVLSDVVLQLLSADRMGLAYHVVRCREEQHLSDSERLPAWLIRALCLGRTVRFAHGETARLLEQDFANFQPQLMQQETAEQSLAVGVLLRAAAMIPALFTGSAGAIAILRAFRIGPDCSQLYNYCSRLALYGQRLHGQLATAGSTTSSPQHLQNELAPLRERARLWLREVVQQTLPATRTSPLYLHAHWSVLAGSGKQAPAAVANWSRWQEVLRTVGRILQPVLNDQHADRSLIKQDVDRLIRQLQGDSATLERPLPTSQTLSPEMRSVYAEAVDLASQWLRLTGPTAAGQQSISAREISELRQEILQRTGPVLVELRALGHVYPSRLLRAAVGCCVRVVEELQALFAPAEWTGCREADPRHVLHRELLKLPAPQLNDQWFPQTSAATLEQELLEHLSHSELDWAEAFHWQCSLLDHVTTGYLLDLDVWPAPSVRADLQAHREQAIAECRQELSQELEEARLELAEAMNLQVLEETEVVSLEQRMDRLHTLLPQTSDFADLQRQIQSIRKNLQRRQQQEVQRMERRLAQLKPRPFGAGSSSSVRLVATPSVPATTSPATPAAPASPTSAWVLDV